MSFNKFIRGNNAHFKFLVSDKATINEKLQTDSLYANYIQISANGLSNLKNYDSLNNKTDNYTYLSCPNGGLGKRFLTGARLTSNTNNQKVALYVEPGAGRCLIGDEINMFSDKRLKENIKSIDENECLKTIVNLEPVHFNFKDSHKINFGFVAQDVVNVVPEIINFIGKFIPDYFGGVKCKKNVLTLNKPHDYKKNDTLKIYHVNNKSSFEVVVKDTENNLIYLSEKQGGLLENGDYFLYGKYVNDLHTIEEIKLIPFLTGAIKQQQKEINEQQKEIDYLKNELSEIKKLIKEKQC